MKVRVQRWGKSLALRIPQSIAASAQLCENTVVELSVVKGQMIVQTVQQQPCALKELLHRTTRRNIQGEWQTGAPVGKEAW